MQVRYCKSAYGGSLTEVDGKGLVFLNRWLGVYELGVYELGVYELGVYELGVYEHVFPDVYTEASIMRGRELELENFILKGL